jgi:uncharacterized protein DUF4189
MRFRPSDLAAFVSLQIAAGVGLLAIGALLPHQAMAMGALAAGIPDDIAAQGVAVGTGYNFSSRDEAEQRALAECKKRDAPQSTLALCKIIAHFDNQCVAVSLDPKDGTPGFGWAIGPTDAAANAEALQICRQTAGSGRAAYCEQSQTNCDTLNTPPK